MIGNPPKCPVACFVCCGGVQPARPAMPLGILSRFLAAERQDVQRY